MTADVSNEVRESAFVLHCEGEPLPAILAEPAGRANETGVVVIVGGPQYRVGSHRQFVLLSRRLAAAGHAVLRFDCRGMGDAGGPQRSFEALSADIGTAVDELQRRLPEVRRVVLWGLCDGASAALLYCDETQDARIGGLCLLNPWVRSEASLARTQIKHYYLQRLRQRAFWMKLLSGKVAGQALAGLLRSLKLTLTGGASPAAGQASAPYQDRMARAWKAFGGEILLLLSGDDYTAKEFVDHAGHAAAWAGALTQAGLSTRHLPGVDHTCSGMASRTLVEQLTLDWLAGPSHSRA